ncbi:VPA1269 family protein [Pseudomonas gingeri]|uniref:Phage integrase family protein n=1 Tax=Pseudomonas gingeri TaxID=117681 RepID=A0A7Y7WK27_9PSED|nr:VPA1269 family protein [Pseudomonas gingeri]NWB49869.1 hypothetical protein [Pseudomonas gingeri]
METKKMPKVINYFTYNEAATIVQSLDIKTSRDYILERVKQPRLPRKPYQHYLNKGWTTWYEFLGTEKFKFYPSLAEAQAAMRSLDIKNYVDYRKHYQKDSRLPRKPEEVYINLGWTNWRVFLGGQPIYSTLEEASKACKALGFKRRHQYITRYSEDPRLPSNPNQFYKNKGWISWDRFLDTYAPGYYERNYYHTYAEAQAAAQTLGLKSRKEYVSRRKEDMRLHSTPNEFYRTCGWIGWVDFLGTTRVPYYDYAEARAAVKAMNITNVREYKLRRHEDPKLPSNILHFYTARGWINTPSFFGRETPDHYATYSEAKIAVETLEIKNTGEYLRRRKEDLKLCTYPSSKYRNSGWTSAAAFFGKVPKNYYSYTEAKDAVRSLGITSMSAYKEKHMEDPRLPKNPGSIYSKCGWTNVFDFFDTVKPDLYSTYVEAREAAQALGIRSNKDYAARYREDPRLPSKPSGSYSKNGWTDWYDFTGFKKPIGFNDVSESFPKIWSDVKRWLENERNLPNKTTALRDLLSGFFKPLGLPDDTRYLLLRVNPFNTEAYQQLVETMVDSRKKAFNSAITAFFRWALDEYCVDTDSDERVVLPGCRNPFETVLAGYEDTLQQERPSQSTKAPLGYEFILRGREFLVPKGEQVLQTKPTLKDLSHLQELFNSRVDWLDVAEAAIDRTDPNCIWRCVKTSRNSQLLECYQLWSPVRFIALYTLLRFPLRGQQILWLDSGEMDDDIAVIDQNSGSISWQKNEGPLAGKAINKRRPQASVQRGVGGLPKLYVTTNKTSRIEGGYDVEWLPDDLAYWFIFLRDWQAKYNPLKRPTSWVELKLNFNKKILKARGSQSFLFRTNGSGTPLTTASAFVELLPALLHRIQRKGEKLATPVAIAKSRFTSPYTPHSLRVSLITAFIAEGDAPIHLISKLVGHSSLVMTIYYIKIGGEQIRARMGDTEKRAAQLAFEREANTIRTQGLIPVRHKLIVTDENRPLIESNVPNSACVIFDWGVCPMSAASCHIGNQTFNERKCEYSPVETGYLGQKNCMRCRFFITGIPFLVGLTALGNEISLEIFTEGTRYQRYCSEVDRLEQEHYDACQENRPDLQESERKMAIANMLQSGSKLDTLLIDFSAINHYVQSCLKIIKESAQDGDDDGGIRLVVSGDLHDIGVAFEESKSQYHLLAEICQNATIYRSANPSRAIPLISQAIDRMAENNNMKPAMFRLTDEQKLVVANELNMLLFERLGSWERIDDLFSGDLMLLDIDAHEPKLACISTEIQNLLAKGATRQLTEKVIIDE